MRAREARASASGRAARPGHRRASVCEREDEEKADCAQGQASRAAVWRAVTSTTARLRPARPRPLWKLFPRMCPCSSEVPVRSGVEQYRHDGCRHREFAGGARETSRSATNPIVHDEGGGPRGRIDTTRPVHDRHDQEAFVVELKHARALQHSEYGPRQPSGGMASAPSA